MTDKQWDPSIDDVPTSYIERDKDSILKYHNRKEEERAAHKRFLESKERVDAVNTVKSLIDEWAIKPEEILEFRRFDDYLCIRDEEPYGTDWSEEGLANSIRIHDALDIDYKCKECLVRPVCCRFSNVERLERNKECDGVSQLLNSELPDDVSDYFYEMTKKQ